jgi:phosphoribosylaminoimidazole-succinocarboxamide synthase
VRKARPLPVEAIVRGYLAGSGWAEYRSSQSVCGVPLSAGLLESGRLPEPLFTPSTKAEGGAHDENITFMQLEKLIGPRLARRVHDVSLELYGFASGLARERGIIIADTKFEFGLLNESELILIDEALTPDSSRFWPLDGYEPGRPQPSFDKQYVRDYLESIGWDKRPPAPELPPDVVAHTAAKYEEARQRLTE